MRARDLARILAIALPLLAWELGVRQGLLDGRFLPPPSEVFPRFLELLQEGELFRHAAASLGTIGLGLALAALLGSLAAVLIALSPWFDALLSPNIEAIRAIAPLALWPAFMLLFGLGTTSKVVMIVWVAWIPILLNLLQGIRSADPELLRMARLFGANRTDLLRTVYLPGALPFLVVGFRLAAGNAFLAIVAAEMIGSSSGLGFYILETSQTFRLKEMYAAIVLIALIGIGVNSLLLRLERSSA